MRASENLAGTVLFESGSVWLGTAGSQPRFPPGYHTARLKHASLLLLTSLSSLPALQGACTLGEKLRDSRKPGAQRPACVAPGLWLFSRTPAGSFCSRLPL